MNKAKLPDLYNCSVGIIGLGYVGLPLIITIAKNNKCLLTQKMVKRKIWGYDLDNNRIEQLKKGIDINGAIYDRNLLNNNSIEFTSKKNNLKDIDVFIVCVPTPLDKNNDPDLSFIKDASKTVGNLINSTNTSNENQIIIFESTVYPGVTEDICVPIIKKFSNKNFNDPSYENSFYCGYSPERINPGDLENTIDSIKKVTSGSNNLVANWIDSFYGSFIKAGTFKAKNIKVAEAAKIIENTQRDINIALVNEFAILFKKLNIDTVSVLKAASTKWNFHNYKPGLVGGHCIGIDPYYLTYKAREIGHKVELISAGRKINDFMYKYLLEQIFLKVKNRKESFQIEEVLILGVSYKENCSDIRNSQIILLIKEMVNLNMNITIFDPVVKSQDIFQDLGITSLKEMNIEKKYSIIIIALSHKEFNSLSINEINKLSYPETIIFDLINKYFASNIFHL